MTHDRPGELARELRGLKDGAGLSFEALSALTGASRSALHRYCAGAAVPAEFAVVERFAKACGADRERLLALHGSWVRATARPGRAAGASPDPPGAGPGVGPGVAASEEPATPPARAVRAWAGWRPARLAVAVCGALVTVAALLSAIPDSAEEHGLLLSEACPQPVGLGQGSECVREVQRLLRAAGASAAEPHGRYDLDTRRRVLAFQVLAGVRPNGVVDTATKQALYRGGVSLATWNQARVAEHIRATFTREPEDAVRVADCRSLLDPLYVMSDSHMSRTWGVFQLSETQIRELGGTLADALDPAWNIEAAHGLWSRADGTVAWPQCLVSVP